MQHIRLFILFDPKWIYLMFGRPGFFWWPYLCRLPSNFRAGWLSEPGVENGIKLCGWGLNWFKGLGDGGVLACNVYWGLP